MPLTDLHGQDEPRIPIGAQSGRASARAIEFDDEEDPQFLRTEKRVAVRRGALPRKARNYVVKGAIVAASVTLLAIAAMAAREYARNSWRFRIESSDNIEITGMLNTPRPQVMDVLGADIGKNIFYVPLEEQKHKLEQIPWVESATVMRLLPNRLAIRIQERTPMAFIQIGPKVSLIDSLGVVMEMGKTHYSFPVIQGIAETEPLSSRAAAMKIYSRLVRELDSDGGNYSHDLSEVDLSDPEDVKVTPGHEGAGVLIHLGSQDFLNRYKLYVTHIAEWKQQFQDLRSVDLRYEGQVIVNPDTNKPTPAPLPPVIRPVAQKQVAKPAWRRRQK